MLHKLSSSTLLPIENSPPGIQTIPLGALPVGLFLFSTVGLNKEAALSFGVSAQSITANFCFGTISLV
ncbi:hypothetical protein D3C86_920620 [compost metagenome]